MAHPHPRPLEDDDLLAEILLRLPPRPSSLPRAAAVCARWRRLVTADPAFLRRFRAHHRRGAPLLGFFHSHRVSPSFVSTMDPPDRVPAAVGAGGRFSLRFDDFRCRILGCRDGLVLAVNPVMPRLRGCFLVWDPVSGDQRRVAFPPECDQGQTEVRNGAVFRLPGGGGGFRFQIVLVGTRHQYEAIGCIYSSETGKWGDLIATPLPHNLTRISLAVPGVRIGDSLYWLISGIPGGILEFDLNEQRLAVIDDVPMAVSDGYRRFCVVPAADGGLGFVFMSDLGSQFWRRKNDWDDDVSESGWVLEKTVQLGELLSLSPTERKGSPIVMGFSEDYNVIFLKTINGLFMVHLESMEFKRILKDCAALFIYPFASVYTAGMSIGDGHDEDGQSPAMLVYNPLNPTFSIAHLLFCPYQINPLYPFVARLGHGLVVRGLSVTLIF
ncbi:uncharacterized protein [Oryza sativa Japonica Group]|uniref:Os02g0249700 protein n=3 Tax=Oryza TaxID=4527 RepID=A3A533_ORYSJ|nr:uncharacterized protein LOC4328882 [Oryza sativa Japonica Group]EAZ22422.1 hypothetical protein OsJ_06083 [Oryza sativa Japonica Group]KAF2944016.1 hypothetical protein DAI22_02g108500 [Oryza sativa Japonica Group]USI00726.1 F-box domain-containing protein [Oryza sativa Japonica Group]BAD19148.1 unknown protein [Oryza sativa Japonica Group]BAD19801.1 unknown protein [Oryza sativa Japonica Group]|eukprot:NP_001046440.1 Os02g0249700 [Oryza sativa Japonica Group]